MNEDTFAQVSDRTLLERIARRDEGAFNELYHRYGRKTLNYFYRMLYQDSQLALDFNQDLWLKVVEKATQYNPAYPVQSWLYSIASNMCKNEYRKRQVRQEAAPYLEHSQPKVTEVSPESSLDHHTFQEALMQQLEYLSLEHRHAFLLRYQAHMPIKEIAQVLDCAEGTVKSRLFYSLKKLSKQLAAFGPNSDSL